LREKCRSQSAGLLVETHDGPIMFSYLACVAGTVRKLPKFCHGMLKHQDRWKRLTWLISRGGNRAIRRFRNGY
jgi:hypothetical protein